MENKVFKLFEGKELFLVGGVVRDRLLDRPTNDLDFATNLLPDEIEKILNAAGYKTYDIGKAFGTISFMLEGNKVEITTYRKNENYTRSNRHPVVEFGTKIDDDLIRRDFTFNALAMDRDGNVVDLFNGVEHLRDGIIETPMAAEEIFSDDPLRILRAVRFRSRFGFEYSEGVKKALTSQAYRVLYLPKERVSEELNKILLGEHVGKTLNDLMEHKLWNYIVPEITVLAATDQDSPFHSKNVWLHTAGVVTNTGNDLGLRWAGLLHDIGKPYVKTFDKTVHFYRHEELSARMAESIMNRLGLPRKLVDEVVYLIRNHMRTNLYDESWSDSAVRRFVVDVGPNMEKLLDLSRADITSHNPTKVQMHLERLEDLKRRIGDLKDYVELKCPLDGKTIMEHFNLTQGPEVGKMKAIIMEALTNGEVKLAEDKAVYLKYLEGKVGVNAL